MKIELGTTFGVLKLDVSMILNPEGKPPSDLQTEPVVLFLRKAVMRCLLLKRKDDIYEDLTKLSGKEDLLDGNIRKYEKQVRECVNEIRDELTKPLKLRKKFKKILASTSAQDLYVQRLFDALFVWFNSSVLEEKEYVKQLTVIKEVLLQREDLKVEEDEEVVELENTLRTLDDNDDMLAYYLERIIVLIDKKRSDKPLFSDFKAADRTLTQDKLDKIKLVDKIRELYSKQCFIGVIGPQNAGKSTMINKVFNTTAVTGLRKHTTAATIYPLEEKTFVVDFPGSNSLVDQETRYQSIGQMNNLFIYLMPYTGTPDKELVNNVKAAYSMQRTSGKGSKTLFCINKAAQNKETEDTFHDNYIQLFVEKIKDDIKKNPFDDDERHLKKLRKKLKKAKEAIAKVPMGTKVKDKDAFEKLAAAKLEMKSFVLTVIKEEDFIFTDLHDPDPERGICGPDDIKARISEFLVEAGIRDQDDVKSIFASDDDIDSSKRESIVIDGFEEEENPSDEDESFAY